MRSTTVVTKKLSTIMALAMGLCIAFSAQATSKALAEKTATKSAAVTEKRTAKQIVTTVCAACHTADGNSVITLNPKLAGQHPEYLVKQLTNFKEGTRANAVMGGMAGALSADDMQNLATYFSEQKTTLGTAKTNGHGSLGEKIYRGGIQKNNVPACASCHGANGMGLPKQFPRLSGQHSDYVLAQMKAFRTGERANAPMMTAISVKLTDQEMAAVADYVQGLR